MIIIIIIKMIILIIIIIIIIIMIMIIIIIIIINSCVKIIPIIIGALGTVNARLGEWLKSIDINCNIGQIQQASLLGTGRILRKVLDT